VICSTSTEHPNSAWVVDQTERFLDETAGREQKPASVMHDRDTKFTKEFTAVWLRKPRESIPILCVRTACSILRSRSQRINSPIRRRIDSAR
jgi:hypothetical protein